MTATCTRCRHDNPDDALFCSKCAQPLKSVVAFSGTQTFLPHPERLREGDTLAERYTIIEELGRGGMGVVYKAEDTKLKRTVALKFLPPGLTHIPEINERFKHEAQAAAALDHPNICTVYEFDESEKSSFISMAYIEGRSLREIIESGPLEMKEALGIASQVAEGLQEAHRKGVVHRDIKSANIMMTETGRVKIMDFGLARMAGGTLLTQEGTTMGTVAYMSPEQARGDAVDHRTDIWSLGVVLYEILSGRLPFQGEREQAVVYAILKERPLPLSDLRAGIPTAVEQVVDKALEKNPDDRYQSMGDLLDDLKSVSAGIMPENIKARLRKAKGRRRKKTFFYAGAAGVIIVAAVFSLTLFTRRAEALNSIAVLPLENLTGDLDKDYFVDGVTDELIGHLSQIAALRVISRRTVMQYKGLDKSLPDIARELNVDAVVEGTVYQVGDRVRLRVQLIDALPAERNLWSRTFEEEGKNVLLMYNEIARTIADRSGVKLSVRETSSFKNARQVDPEAYEAYLKGQFHGQKFTKEDLEIALQYYNLALEKDPDFALGYFGIASVWGSRTYFGMTASEVMPFRKAALDKCIQLDPMLPEAHYMLAGNATWFEFDWDKAEKEFHLTFELNPNHAHARVFYGLFLTAMGRFEEAREQMRIGIALDPLNAMHQSYLGLAYLRDRRYDEAIAEFRKGLALQPNFADAISGLWQCFHMKGLYDEALAEAKRVYAARGDQDILDALDRGSKKGGYQEAMQQAAVAYAARSNRAYSMRIATFYTYAGDKDLALDWLEIAYQERMQNLVYLNVYPKWDLLRDDPRFQELLRKMNFPAEKR